MRRIANPLLANFSSNIYSSAFVDRLKKVKIVDSTLREGEQFLHCNLKSHEKIHIAKQLIAMKIDYIETMSPIVSDATLQDCKTIAALPRTNTKIVTHTRCHINDINKAIESGVDGVNMYMATSELLAKCSHGKAINEIIAIAIDMIKYVKSKGLEVRFSCEDSFRSDIADMLKIYSAVVDHGVDRIGIADTVGVADSYIVRKLFKTVRNTLPTIPIEFHCHNDTGSANENAFTAIRHGATHIDTTVLGIGERNGITQLGAILSKMACNPEMLEHTKSRYNLSLLHDLDKYVATICNIQIPHCMPITGTSFVHKAGVHSNAAIKNPNSYEILKPELFGIRRNICVASKITGKNAVRQRATELGIVLPETELSKLTVLIKNIFDTEEPDIAVVDRLIYAQRESKPSALAEDNIDSIANVKLTGHLLDKDILGNVANICTRNNVVKYDIEFHPALRDDQESVAFVKIRMGTKSELDSVVNKLTRYVDGMNYDGFSCRLEVV